MAILDQIRGRRGVFSDLDDVVGEIRKQTNGVHPAEIVDDARAGASDVASNVSQAAKDASESVRDTVKDASESVRDTVKDASDNTRERIDFLSDLIRDLAREWSKAGSEMRLDERVDEIAQRLRAAMPAASFKGAVSRLERELPDTDKDRYDRAFERGRVRTRTIYLAGGAAAGIAAGIAAAMLLDPQRGVERRARIARFKDDATRQLAARTRDVTARAKAMAAERGIGQPKPDPTGVTTDREMVPVMPVGQGTVTDPSSIVREPLPEMGGGIHHGVADAGTAPSVDASADRSVSATHG
jgi:gas vesicle protein